MAETESCGASGGSALHLLDPSDVSAFSPGMGFATTSVDEVVLQNSQENLRLNEIQLLLSEKRTALSTLRTGIALLALPVSVVSVLVATSSLYNVLDVLYLVAPLLAFCVILVVLGSYLVLRAILRMRAFDQKVRRIEESDPIVRDLIGDE